MSDVNHLAFIDSGVLIAAARGVDPVADRALAVLGNSALRFASSPLVRLEVLPKALFFDRTAEANFYRAFFEKVEVWAPLDANVVSRAFDEAVRHGLSAVDALLLVSASSVGAEYLVTTEAKSKPIHRTDLVKVVSLTL